MHLRFIVVSLYVTLSTSVDLDLGARYIHTANLIRRAVAVELDEVGSVVDRQAKLKASAELTIDAGGQAVLEQTSHTFAVSHDNEMTKWKAPLSADSMTGLEEGLHNFLASEPPDFGGRVISENEGALQTLELPEWTLQAPFFASSSSEQHWHSLPMPFGEEQDVINQQDTFKGRGYKLRILVDRNVVLPSREAAEARCNGGRWAGGTPSFTLPDEHYVDAAAVDEPNTKVLIAARPAGPLWAHWIDNTFLKFGWLYPLMKQDADHWTIYDTHGEGDPQDGVKQAISVLGIKDESVSALSGNGHSVGSLMTVCDMPSPHPFTMHGARAGMLLAAGAPDLSVADLKRSGQCEVIYMQRNGPYTLNGRQLSNEDAIYEMIQQHVKSEGVGKGFRPDVLRFSYDSTVPLQDHVKRMSAGCVFIGAHGSSLHHTLWGARGSTLVELFPKEASPVLSFNVFWAMASGLGMKYGFASYFSSQDGADVNEIQKLLVSAMN